MCVTVCVCVCVCMCVRGSTVRKYIRIHTCIHAYACNKIKSEFPVNLIFLIPVMFREVDLVTSCINSSVARPTQEETGHRNRKKIHTYQEMFNPLNAIESY